MPDTKSQNRRHLTEAARIAAAEARAAKKAMPDRFGEPEVYITRASDKAFTWEIRRFGGVLLKRGETNFLTRSAAEAAGAEALNVVLQAPDLPSFQRAYRSGAGASTEHASTPET